MRQLTNIPELGGETKGPAGEVLNPVEFQGEWGWYKELGGIAMQGNRSTSLTVALDNPFSLKTIGVFIQGLDATMSDLTVVPGSITTTGFTVVGGSAPYDFFWQAIGV